MRIIQILALALIAGGIGVFIVDRHPGSEIPLLVGLATFFMVKPKMYDERLLSIKATSAYAALIVGYAIKLVSSSLYKSNLISWQLIEINYFLILVFTTALLFYYTRIYFTSN